LSSNTRILRRLLQEFFPNKTIKYSALANTFPLFNYNPVKRGKFYLSTDTFKSAANLESNLAFIELFEFCYERKTRFSEITNYLSRKGWPGRAGRKTPV